MFDNTELSKETYLGDNITVVVYEPKYFESLNEALQNDTDLNKEDLGN